MFISTQQWQICIAMFQIPSLFCVISHAELSKHTAVSINLFDALWFELHCLYSVIAVLFFVVVTQPQFSFNKCCVFICYISRFAVSTFGLLLLVSQDQLLFFYNYRCITLLLLSASSDGAYCAC